MDIPLWWQYIKLTSQPHTAPALAQQALALQQIERMAQRVINVRLRYEVGPRGKPQAPVRRLVADACSEAVRGPAVSAGAVSMAGGTGTGYRTEQEGVR